MGSLISDSTTVFGVGCNIARFQQSDNEEPPNTSIGHLMVQETSDDVGVGEMNFEQKGRSINSCEATMYIEGRSLIEYQTTNPIDKGDPTRINENVEARGKDKLFSCDMCDYVSNTSSDIRAHKRVHTKKKPFSCYLCDFKSAHFTRLKEHMNIHTVDTGDKPYCCDTCDYKSNNARDIKHHMRRAHTKERPFACHMCDYRGARTNHLKSHMKMHTGEKPFTCDKCGYRSAYPSDVKRHIMNVHKGE